MNLPRIMFAAPRSGSGKTMVVCGILQALLNRNRKTACFKCGPDYIDPMFHSRVLGMQTGNMDTFFTEDEAMLRGLFGERAQKADLSVIEGVMGFYDGLGITSEKASSYDLARALKAPVILVVDGRGMGISLAAECRGFLEYHKDSGIRGILLNRVSGVVYQGLKETLEQKTGVPVLGYIPVLEDIAVESRHLGLVTPEEIKDLKQRIKRLASVMEKTVNLDKIIALAESAESLTFSVPCVPHLESPVRIGVAKDEAFCFYYQENLELLRKMGAELVYFSPIRDKKMPESLDGLLFGGGYPELYAEQLSENRNLLLEIHALLVGSGAGGGIPCLAECGGYLYLGRRLTDVEGKSWPMADVLAAEGYWMGKSKRFGYVELNARQDTVLGKAGTRIRGHEFHYFDSTDNGTSFYAKKPLRDTGWECIHGQENIAAGFPHLYYYSNPDAVFHYLNRCLAFRKMR